MSNVGHKVAERDFKPDNYITLCDTTRAPIGGHTYVVLSSDQGRAPMNLISVCYEYQHFDIMGKYKEYPGLGSIMGSDSTRYCAKFARS